MAAKLESDGKNVVHLSTRKAKGAKSTGGRARKPRLIPAKHEDAPKRSGPKPETVIGVQPTDAELRRNMQDKLIGLHSKHRTIDNRLEVALAAISDIKLEKKEVRAAIENSGFPLSLYDEAYKELKLKTARIDLEQKEQIRGLIREALGLPAGPQPSLLDKLPEAAKPAVYWDDIGFREGMAGDAPDEKKAHVPPENLQDYLKGHGRASERHAQGIKTLAKEMAEPKRDAKPLVDIEAPFWAEYPAELKDWQISHRATFRAWFEKLTPEDEVDLDHPGAEAFFDQLETEAHPSSDAEEFT